MTDQPVRHFTAEFTTVNDANHWLDTIPAGWRVLASELHDLRGVPGGKIVVEVTVTRDPSPLADVKAAFAAHGLNVEWLEAQAVAAALNAAKEATR